MLSICGGAGLQSRASCVKTQNVHLDEFTGTKEVAWFTSVTAPRQQWNKSNNCAKEREPAAGEKGERAQ